MSSHLTRGVARNEHVRVFACDTTELVDVAREKHNLYPCASAALGRTMSVGCIMGSMLKTDKEKLTIQINGGGPMGTVMVDAYANGNVRGFVADPEVHFTYNDTGKLAVGYAMGREGTLKVIKDMGMGKETWTGTVELQTGEIGDDFAYYFTVSEQTPSAVSVGVLVDTDNHVLSSGGLIIQMMPESTEEDIVYVEEKLKDLKPISTLIHEGMTPIQIVESIFEDYHELETRELRFECNCSRERCLFVLNTLDPEEIRQMMEEDHGCNMHCEFCNSDYHFSEEELRVIYDTKLAKSGA
ncbi:MAG: Hsp33 family molecular chaperone HslO [Erysipelotrichaceae bacterium]|nr:Hsp33 family molecular chaperone HslO [Erysipelotrichaceae bacterium]